MKYLDQILTIANLVIMVALIIMIALQNKSTGLSSVFGGSGVTTTRRGVDKWLLYATAIAGFLFAGLSLTSVLLNR